MNDDALLGIFLILFILLGVAINVFIAFSLWDTISRTPKQYRAIEPYFAWLTLIPLAGFIFFWILIPFKIPESLKNTFLITNPMTLKKTIMEKNMG